MPQLRFSKIFEQVSYLIYIFSKNILVRDQVNAAKKIDPAFWGWSSQEKITLSADIILRDCEGFLLTNKASLEKYMVTGTSLPCYDYNKYRKTFSSAADVSTEILNFLKFADAYVLCANLFGGDSAYSARLIIAAFVTQRLDFLLSLREEFQLKTKKGSVFKRISRIFRK